MVFDQQSTAPITQIAISVRDDINGSLRNEHSILHGGNVCLINERAAGERVHVREAPPPPPPPGCAIERRCRPTFGMSPGDECENFLGSGGAYFRLLTFLRHILRLLRSSVHLCAAFAKIAPVRDFSAPSLCHRKLFLAQRSQPADEFCFIHCACAPCDFES